MSAPISPGERLHTMLGSLRTQNGGVLTREQWIKAADDFIALEIQATRKTPRAKGTPAARNILFDTLALATGTRDLSQLTRSALKAIGVALADIKQACPDVTPEEIQKRAAAYRAKYPTWQLTPPSLAKYWSQFGKRKDSTRTGLLDPYQEPAGWRDAARIVYPNTLVADAQWFDIGVDIRTNILRHMERTLQAAPNHEPPADHA